MINIIVAMIVGTIIGYLIEREHREKIENSSLRLIKDLEEEVYLKREYIHLLENDYIKYYKDAYENTIQENIDLKKKLNRGVI